ncbi:hypothetical protein N1851_028331 [Merluccius polli]|uniref:Uncharacterized protein n=1 Tax=Merluccius polli TaxID=89951 RepID=A0AA47M7K1_MERPO|nr:hypothetical protein N1851_029066 [Merluccius polli]KAK0135834.1 hypothetical protein N1851_028331 [Merluccius polli]
MEVKGEACMEERPILLSPHAEGIGNLFPGEYHGKTEHESEGKRERDIDRQMGAALAVMQALYRTVVVKRELSHEAKLSI